MGSIYLIRNLRNNKCYIGQTIHDAEKTRIRDHFYYPYRSNVVLSRAIEKYGKEAFTYEILHDGIIPAMLDSYEIEAIQKFNTVVPNGYNLNYGGSGNLHYPEYGGDKNKRQNAWRNKRYANDPEFREKEQIRKREFYANHIESCRERGRKYYRENKNTIKTKLSGRRSNDPDFRQRQRDATKKHRSKPGVREHQRAYGRERYANNPEIRERQNHQRRERYVNDPSYRENRKQKQRERYKALSEDSEYRKRLAKQERKRFNDRYANDLDFRERYKSQKREQYHQKRKVEKIFHTLPSEMSLPEKQKILRKKFPDAPKDSTLYRWIRKWQSELTPKGEQK